MSLTWPAVRDNHLIFWNGGNWLTHPDYPVASLTTEPGGQRDKVLAALELLYTSPTFKTMIDGWIASGGKLQIAATSGDTRAVSYGSDPLNRYILLNFDQLASKNWVNDVGELVSDRLEITIAHEMIHIYKGYGDGPEDEDRNDLNKNGTSYDYAGDVIRYENKIVAELGEDFARYRQASYGSVHDAYAAYLGLLEGRSYTSGETIDVWRRGSDGDDALNHANRTVETTTFDEAAFWEAEQPPQLRDLIFGFAGEDTIFGGLGNDHLFGGDENDILVGGGGDDQLWGGMLDDSGRTDGTDTARYHSAPARIVITIGGTDLTVTDGEGGTDTLHSIEIIEGSNFADTLVVHSLTTEIVRAFDFIDLGGSDGDTIDLSTLAGNVAISLGNPQDQTVTLGDAVLHVRNVERFVAPEGGQDELALTSSDCSGGRSRRSTRFCRVTYTLLREFRDCRWQRRRGPHVRRRNRTLHCRERHQLPRG